MVLGEPEVLSGAELLAALGEEEESSAVPTLTVTCFDPDTPLSARNAVEEGLASFVERQGLGEWVGSGQGSIGSRSFFDVTFSIRNPESAIPRIAERLRELGAGSATTIEGSVGGRQKALESGREPSFP